MKNFILCKFARSFFVFSILVVFFLSPICGQEDFGAISGHVSIKGTGSPLEEAQIMLRPTDETATAGPGAHVFAADVEVFVPRALTVATDRTGAYSFTDLAPGNYRLEISYRIELSPVEHNVFSKSVDLAVRLGQHVVHDVELSTTPAEAGVWQEYNGIGVPYNPGGWEGTTASLDLVRVQTPRQGGNNQNMDVFPPYTWIEIDVTKGWDKKGRQADTQIPSDIKSICLVGRGQIAKGTTEGGETTFLFVRAIGSDEERMLWKVRSTNGANGVRENLYGCVPVIDGKFEFKWVPTWPAESNNKPAGSVVVRANMYFR